MADQMNLDRCELKYYVPVGPPRIPVVVVWHHCSIVRFVTLNQSFTIVMSQIPIVKGTIVQEQPAPPQYGQYGRSGNDSQYNQSGYVQQQQDPYGVNASDMFGSSDTSFNGVKGTPQAKGFKDVIFAIAFIIHLVVMMVVMAGFTVSAQNGYNYKGVVYCVSTCALVALGLSTMALGFMMNFATELVKIALFFSVGCSLAVGILGALSSQMLMCIVGFASFLLGCCYAYFVWPRIPFAAANLRTGLAGVRSNLGLTIVAYVFLALAFAWTVWWSIAAGAAMSSIGGTVLFLFFLSFYWTHEVLKNTVHVTVAGVIGTWWFAPEEASSFCSGAIMDSFVRATTYSFGSICFGSLLVAIVQALRALHRHAHENDDCSFVICIVDCILGCIEGIIEYLNKWAYVYVGLYGYSYLDGGRNVMTLFQNKGWSTIIADDLADNVLFMVSVAIGLFTGLVGLIIATLDKNIFAGVGYDDNVGGIGFIVGFLVGYLFASITMSVVASAVNTVIVCFAEAPAEFEQNHPLLSQEMRGAWVRAWPEFSFNA